MTTLTHPWERRFDRVVSALLWLMLALGVFLSVLQLGPVPRSLLAAVAAGTYVLSAQILPRWLLFRRWVIELAGIVGVVLTMSAVALTGDASSPYLLLSLLPVLFVSAFAGLRVGLETALFATAALTAVTAVSQEGFSLMDVVTWGGLYTLIAGTFSYARQLLVEEEGRAQVLEMVSHEAVTRMRRLESAHRLLSELVDLADEAELNPVSAGNAALESLATVVPFDAAVVALSGDEGPVVVAKRGGVDEEPNRTLLPIQVGKREVGLLVLARDEPFDPSEHALIQEAIRPMSLAFDNILLLQDIARRAVREERARLARELHDEIGPSLASLGLALDFALLQHPADPSLATHLSSLRQSVTGLVEEVRTTVADLRQPEHESLVEHARRLVGLSGQDGPEIEIALDELRPPRPSMLHEFGAIVSEAVRNAIHHAQATTIRIEGTVEGDRGLVRIRDDGKGFDPSRSPEGHFGLAGMRERAEKVGATLTISSQPGQGAVVTVEWDRP